MAVSTTPAREKRSAASGGARKRKNKQKPSWLAFWWPLLLGIAVTPFAIHGASIMALAGPGALTTLYPWVLLLKNPALGPGGGVGDNLSQLLMYIQFPLYGLLMALILRAKSPWFALGVAAALHCLAVAAVFLVSNRVA